MKRRKLTDQWYEFDISQGKAGIRCHSRGFWGYYFRAPDGSVIGQQEYAASSYAQAKERIEHYNSNPSSLPS